MTSSNEDPVPGPIYDPESFRDCADVPFHEDRDTVDEETLDTLDEMDDMAPVGVTDEEGETLVMQVTETCDWKIPAPTVGPGEDFSTAVRQWVETNAGIVVELDSVEAVWHLEARNPDGSRTAERYFVVFGASPKPGRSSGDGDAEGTEWHTDLPADAVAVPGTGLFFD